LATPFDQFRAKLGIGQSTPKNSGFNYAPTIIQNGQTQSGADQNFLDRLSGRKSSGQDIYSAYRQKGTTRVANDLIQKSAGLKFDEFGKPDISLTDFGQIGQNNLRSIGQFGDLATQGAEARAAYKNAVNLQDLGSYGFGGVDQASGTDIPGASSDNVGAKAAAMAAKVMKNGTPYVWGGNSLSNGIDCSGLVQQIYRQLGVSLPRTTYEQAKNGKAVPASQARPGDLVFYGGDYHHVGIYIGNGHVIHAANSKLGVITSNLNNSNGRPTLILRPY
jgi:cell wall-associated NlpC family hydrolase